MTINIPIKILSIEDDGCHLLVKGKFNGKSSGWLIIDTGASKTVFDLEKFSSLATIIPHDENKLKSSGINEGFLENKLAVLKKFQIEDLILKDYEVVLLNLSHINNLYNRFCKYKIAGLLGGDFLQEFNATINYKNKTLSLNYKK